MPRFRTLPPQETRDEITNQTEALVNAIKGHPCYAPPWPAQGIGYVLDAVERTHYILTELSNIRDEKQVRYPEQIPTNNIDNNTFDYPPRQKQAPVTDGESLACECLEDVVQRTLRTNSLIQNPSGLGSLGLTQIDFGENIRSKSATVVSIVDKMAAS